MMMLMKEVNCTSGPGWSLPSLISTMYHDPKRDLLRLWKNVSRWAICAQDSDKFFVDISPTELREGLKLFATTNLKKTAGGGQSNDTVIRKEAKAYYEEWMQEIEILDPQLIVCAGTFSIVKDAMNMHEQLQVCSSGAEYFICSKGRVFLNFVHPTYRISDRLMFAYFKDTLKSFREAKLL